MQRERAAQAVVVVIAFTVLSKVLGFVREMMVAAYYGAGAVTDAYLTATLVIMLILNIIGARSLGTVFIPVYYEVCAKGGRKRAEKFTGTVLTLAFTISLLTAVLCFVFAPLLVGSIVPGLPSQTRELAVCFTRLLVAGMPLLAISGLLASLLNVHNNFSVQAAQGIPLNVAVMCFIFFSGAGVVSGLAAGTMAGYLAQALVTLQALKKRQVRIFAGVDCHEPGLTRLGRLLLPVMAGGVVTQLNPVINRILASGLPEGTISALSYADRIIQMPLGLLVTAIIAVSYPAMSSAYTREKSADMIKMVNSWSGVMLFVVAPISLILAFLSYPLVQVIFERGAFSGDATGATAGALLYYSIGLPFVAWGRFLARVFYTYHDSRTPTFIAMAVTFINIIFCLVLVKPMGHCGLALASTVSAAAGVPLTLFCLKSKTGNVFDKRMLKKVILIAAATAVAGLTMIIISATIGDVGQKGFYSNFCCLILIGGAGMASYFFSARFLKLEEAAILLTILKKFSLTKGGA